MNEIRYGQTVSYKHIAQRINKPNGIRAVSNAIAKNPCLIVIPCHRVIGENGDLKGYRAGLKLKQQLIDLEHT
ncbi:methylated-DNA--[protein]-cysteine S-methyltransferase [Staphylococcus caeli]|uniref:methylated-DNA--[protein]-cysteine S-methyltransferase n=1 Tax=Staphylococcus caeli TaxID=2201815 RepID=UPI003F57F7AC